ncbi:MAG: phosphoribosylformylglycinamidine synthase [Myxococcales bacterium]|nr:phosphoribosylformylglycinamidine synthase [Myxococcales bacterium]
MKAPLMWWTNEPVPMAAEAAGVLAGATSRFVYLVFANDDLDAAAHGVLASLLGPNTDEPSAAAYARFVVPRAGMQTPWSSKATDILRRCGLAVSRIERIAAWQFVQTPADQAALHLALADRMTQQVVSGEELPTVFLPKPPGALRSVALGGDEAQAGAALREVNTAWGLALSDDEISYLAAQYRELGRDPTDCELMMFAQANSEHCRHKIFNATFEFDGVAADASLFGMIRQTTAAAPGGVLSAYSDNAAVLQGAATAQVMWPDGDGIYRAHAEPSHIVLKVETHNHPTAISPYPGAATGSGGELRDEGATGLGGKPKAGMVGYAVSDLHLPDAAQPWETAPGKPEHIASPLQIMIEAPLGAAAYNNEFGRPALAGFFRTLGLPRDENSTWGFHKPLMIAGGIGSIRQSNVHKRAVEAGDALIVLGGPGMLIGLGGGAASSVGQGQSQAALDFASVQRDNAELQRRCQEVISTCAQQDANPIVSVHDVGAGGLANALPELVHADRLGARIDLDQVPSADPSLSPMELWCNESQERYVIALRPADVAAFAAMCERERCPFAVVGHATGDGQLTVLRHGAPVVDVPLSLILGATPKMLRSPVRPALPLVPLSEFNDLGACLERVLALPSVADKGFLVTIGDRTVGGLTARDQMIGPRQVPVADCAVTAVDFHSYAGEAFAIGERPVVATIDAAASAQLAIGEALTNLAAVDYGARHNIKLSCNWMAAAHVPEQDAALYDAVAAAVALCKAVGVAVPVGKDSLSMASRWRDAAGEHHVVSPVTLVATAASPVADIRKTLTPLLLDAPSALWLFDLAHGAPRLGGSALAQVFGQLGDQTPQVDAAMLAAFLDVISTLSGRGLITAYHDRSDGGAVVTAFEMALTRNVGLTIEASSLCAAQGDVIAALFSEALGAVVQVPLDREAAFLQVVAAAGLAAHCHRFGVPQARQPELVVTFNGAEIMKRDMMLLRSRWSSLTYRMQRLRDNPACADFEHLTRQRGDALVHPKLPEEIEAGRSWRRSASVATTRPRVAVLRDQGINGQTEMAAAFTRAGFDAIDVHVSDLEHARKTLRDVQGLAACGGFSYGDVLGAGQGWAKSMRYVAAVKAELAQWFARQDPYFVLGVCNGCQMLAGLADLIPGAAGWPLFAHNESRRYEARLVTIKIEASPSLLLAGMAGWRLPVVVSHGEGRADYRHLGVDTAGHELVAARYVDAAGDVTMAYPYNPNGSVAGVGAVTNRDGRVTILMPHPERVFRLSQMSWHPPQWRSEAADADDSSPWMRLFDNARAVVS